MNAPAPRTDLIRARDDLLAAIDQQRAQFTLDLPDGVGIDQFMRLARQQILTQPALAECSASSVLRALAQCAASGLQLDGRFSSLIIRKSKHGRPTAVWDPTYRGMTSLALASGYVRDVQAYCVRSEDQFSVELGTAPRIVHVPCLLPRCGEVIAAYAFAMLLTGGQIVEVLGRADLEKIRAMSPAGESGPWSAWADEQAKKSAIRRLLKRLPAASVRGMSAPATVPMMTRSSTPSTTSTTCEPERANALECSALERLSAAETPADLEAAFAQTVVDFSQARIALPVRVEAMRNDRREALQQREEYGDE